VTLHSAVDLDSIWRRIDSTPPSGQAASYIDALSRVDPDKFGIAMRYPEGQIVGSGDWQETFSIQSISKLFALALAMEISEEESWGKFGFEPSLHRFNTTIELETQNGQPRNPFVNSGALVVADHLLSHFKDPKSRVLEMIRTFSENQTIRSNETVAKSEAATAHRNMAIAHLLKDFGTIRNDVDHVLDLYFFCCAIEASCLDLAKAVSFLAPDHAGRSATRAQRILRIMQLGGLYGESGTFACRVGVPAKSGVGGGIVAILSGGSSAAVWSPRINDAGNSIRGMQALAYLEAEGSPALGGHS